MTNNRAVLTKINVLLFILMYAFRSFTDAIYVSKGIESNIWINIKYIILAVSCVLCFIQLFGNKKKLIFKKEFENLVIVIVSLFILFALIISSIIKIEVSYRLILTFSKYF